MVLLILVFDYIFASFKSNYSSNFSNFVFNSSFDLIVGWKTEN